MKRPLIFPVLLLLLTGLAHAVAPPELGANLAYVRVHSLPDAVSSLGSELAVKHACVLDVRYATATPESIAALRAALAGHPAGSPVFILISPSTPVEIIAAIDPKPPGSYITLGIAGSHPAPRITVKTETETDRQAYDAFEHGTPLAELISGKIEKDRFDEATLVQEFKNGNPDPEPPASSDPTELKSTTTAEKAAPLIDHVLQRALHLHQALLALHR